MSNPLVENIIEKLENFKYNYLIRSLENYTEQLAAATAATAATTTPATTTPATTTPATTTAATTTAATAAVAATPKVSLIPPAPATPATSTEEEVKKSSEEAKKFENNMMDSLKWVFIGIALFIVLLIILGFVYWFMFGDVNTTHNSEVNDINPNGATGAPGVDGAAGAAGATGVAEDVDAEIPADIPIDASADNADNVDNANMFSFLSSSFSNKEPVIEENTMSNSIQQNIPNVPVDVSAPIIPEAVVEPVVIPASAASASAASAASAPPTVELPAAASAASAASAPPTVELPAAPSPVVELPVSIMGEPSVPKNTGGVENKVDIDKRGGYTVYTY